MADNKLHELAEETEAYLPADSVGEYKTIAVDMIEAALRSVAERDEEIAAETHHGRCLCSRNICREWGL